MSTDTTETRTDQASGDEEEEWASDEAGAAQEAIMAEGFRSASDAAQNTEPAPSTDPVHSTDPDPMPVTETQDSPVPEGIAKPEDLGGRDIGAGGEPLVAAGAQEEFLARWTGIQVSFLEDPAGAVESAGELVEEISAAIRTSLEERGGELVAGGRAASDTEQLRLALRQYRAFISVVLPK